MEFRGSQKATGCRFAIIVSSFNSDITEGLLKGAREALTRAAVRDDDVTVVHVPGAFEIPVTATELGATGEFNAIICLGCLIKGETMHFEYIASATCTGISDAASSTGVPMALGVITTLTEEQARARAADGPGNKGWEAAQAAIEMATLFSQLRTDPDDGQS